MASVHGILTKYSPRSFLDCCTFLYPCHAVLMAVGNALALSTVTAEVLRLASALLDTPAANLKDSVHRAVSLSLLTMLCSALPDALTSSGVSSSVSR